MTHSHQLDLALVHAALADERFPYVGLIGSDSKRARFEKRLAEAGVSRGADRRAGLPDRRRRHRLEGAGGDRRGDRRPSSSSATRRCALRRCRRNGGLPVRHARRVG